MTLLEAKNRLKQQYRHVDGFVGVGIGRHDNRDVLRVFVREAKSPAAKQLKHDTHFEGYPVEVEVSNPRAS